MQIRGGTRSPPAKRRRLAPISDELGELIDRDLKLFKTFGWEAMIRLRQGRGDISSLHKLRHPARRLLRQYKHRGAPVILRTAPWTPEQNAASIHRGPHRSAHEHVDFLRSEFTEMVNRAQWIVLPYDAVKHLRNLRISPMGCVPQHDRRPRTIVDYTFFGLNDDTLPIAPLDAMQFGNALPRLLRHVVMADPAAGPVQLIKVDISDGFYRIGVRPEDVPKLGVAFPTDPDQPQLVAFPITLPMDGPTRRPSSVLPPKPLPTSPTRAF